MNANPSTFSSAVFWSACGLCVAVAGFIAGRASVASQARTILVTNTIQSVSAGLRTFAGVTPNMPVNTASAAHPWNEREWREWRSRLATPERNAALAALLESLAASDPDRAMALARGEGNLKFRETLIQAVLHGWARTSPLSAANWAMALPDSGERDKSLETVFAGAVATNPDTALAVGEMVMQEYPSASVGCGSRLIDALCRAGDFDAAAQLAARGNESQRSFWLGEAFSTWASFQPESAAQAAEEISDPQIRSQALHGVMGGWAQANPAGLVQFLARLPAGGDRGTMLGQALKSWVQSDPVAAANWMGGNNQFGADLDHGEAEVATMESLPPEVALAWAENISSAQLRSATMTSVLRSWADNDPGAAQRYFQTTTDLLPADRQRISETFADLVPTTPVQ